MLICHKSIHWMKQWCKKFLGQRPVNVVLKLIYTALLGAIADQINKIN